MTVTDLLPSSPDDLLAAAKSLYSQWRLNEAQATLESLLKRPGKHEVAALNLYADILWSLGDLPEATSSTERVLAISPLDHQAARRARWLGLSTDTNRLTEQWVRTFITSGGKPSVVFPALVRLLNEEGRHQLALETATEGMSTLGKQKTDERVINKLILEVAIAKENLGDLPGAIEALDKINPLLPVAKSAALSRARMLHEMGHFAEAEAALSPHYNDVKPAFNVPRYHILLSHGRIRDAFHLYRSRKETDVFRKLISNYGTPPSSFSAGAWQNDKVLLIAEGGPGDELRMSSLYGDILQHANNVTISCDPRLQSILARTYPDAKFVPSPRFRDELRKSDYSSRNEVRDALGAKLLTNDLLRFTQRVNHTTSIFEFLEDLRPDKTRFDSPARRNLAPDPDLANEFRRDMCKQTRRVGLAWRSMISNSTRNKHYFEPEDLLPLKELTNTEFYILQPQYTDEEIEKLSKFIKLRVIEGIDLVDDFESQAALISCLDAVIAPCTTTAELAGALGVETLILANTHMTAWRQNPDGSDVWHPRSKLILGDTIGDRRTVVLNAVKALKGLDHRPQAPFVPVPKKPNKSRAPKPLSKKQKIKKALARIPGLRPLKWHIDSFILSVSPTSSARQAYTIEAKAKNLIRQKDVKPKHISEADALVASDRSRTMLAVKATLQARSGKFRPALSAASQLPYPTSINSSILPAIRTEMSDLGRHDLAKEGLRLLLEQTQGDPEQAAVRMGNADFEKEAFEFLSSIKQPSDPKGYVVIFGLNNRVTLGLMCPIAWQLAKQGYHVCSSVAAAMKPSSLPQLDGISGAIRWSGMSLTDEPFDRRKLRNEWEVDLQHRVVLCDGINFFTFFAERLGKLSNSYDVDMANPKVFAAFEALLHRSDVALTVCKRLLGLAKEGKPIRLAAMDTHFAPAGIVRKWCEEVGTKFGIELVAVSISYENYYSNLTTLEANTISVENLTAYPDVRHPLFGGRQRFDNFISVHPETLTAKDEVMSYITINRSKTEEADVDFRNTVIKRAQDCRSRGGKVFAALGKVLIDFAAPYDRGHTFMEFSEWVRFLTSEVEGTGNLLIIKPHPHEKRSEIAAPGVQTLRDLLPAELPKNVVFLDHAAFNSYELADLVDLTFVWNGTAYTEFPVLGKPVVAESIWAERDYPLNATSLHSREDYASVLRGERDVHLSAQTVQRATAFIQFMKSAEVAIPFGYVRRAGTNQSIGSISFIQKDMDELKVKPDPNLELVASRFFGSTEGPLK